MDDVSSLAPTESKSIPIRGALKTEKHNKYTKDFQIINELLDQESPMSARSAMSKLSSMLISSDKMIDVPDVILEKIASKFETVYETTIFHKCVIYSIPLICQKNMGYSVMLAKYNFIDTLIEMFKNIDELDFQFDELAMAITYLSIENMELFAKLDEGYVFELLEKKNNNNYDFVLTAIALYVSSKFLTIMSDELILELTNFSKSVLTTDHKMIAKRIVDASCIYSRIVELRSANKFAACQAVEADGLLSSLIPMISEGDMPLTESILIMYTAVTNNDVICRQLIQEDKEIQHKLRTIQGGLCPALLQAGFIDNMFSDIFYNGITKATECAHQLLFTVFSNILVCPNLRVNINSIVTNDDIINRVEDSITSQYPPLITASLRFTMILIYKAGKDVVRGRHILSHPEGGDDLDEFPSLPADKGELQAIRFARKISLFNNTSTLLDLGISIDAIMYALATLYHLMTLPQELIPHSDYKIDSLSQLVFSDEAYEVAQNVLESDNEEFHHLASVIVDVYNDL